MFIQTIDPSKAEGELAELYQRVGNPDGTLDNVMRVHSLSPASLRVHFDLYVTAMHKRSPLSRVEREIVGTVVSQANGCEYCCQHHAAGLRRLLPEDRKHVADEVLAGEATQDLTVRERAMTAYAAKLAKAPASVDRGDIEALRAVGLDDRAILDLVQVIAYFAYVNRIVLGLGVGIEPAGIGQHPNG